MDINQFNEIVMRELAKIQFNPFEPQYSEDTLFPDLPPLTNDQVEEVLNALAVNKAISVDLISDVFLKEEGLKARAAEIFNNLWNSKLNQVKNIEKHFQTRLIALNKVFPKIPLPNEFRPIVVESLVMKVMEVMEVRFLPKLQLYLLNDMTSGVRSRAG